MPTPSWLEGVPAPVHDVLAATNFLPWFEVSEFDDGRLPAEVRAALGRSGAYVVAISKRRPPDDPLTGSVHYVGMTKGETSCLATRITAFATAARGGLASHSGGNTWAELGLSHRFWIRPTPSMEIRTSGWSSQAWCIWPEVVEKALLMAYAHRHGSFPRVNKEGWKLPEVTAEMVDRVARVLVAKPAAVVARAREAIGPIRSAWGYASAKIHDDPGREDPDWIGAQASLSKGYWLWIGRVRNECSVGIWKNDDSPLITAEIRSANEIAAALAGVLHGWHTSAGLV